ncbi:MAG: hypothetical protein JO257_17735 [Deltaproteobacteria bacterium]|nr:hypothetical protein [Deltaproteobacteria bacterium]
MDPYRGDSRIGACPRCGNELVANGDLALACLRGFGEWYPRETAAIATASGSMPASVSGFSSCSRVGSDVI